MNRSSHIFACAAITASLVLPACRSVSPSEAAETVIAVSAFETLGNAQATVAQDMAASLVTALNSDPHIRARLETAGSSASLDYKVKDLPQALVTLGPALSPGSPCREREGEP